MQNNPVTSNQHKGLPIENWDHYNKRVIGFPTGEHAIEIFMRDPVGELSYVKKQFWIQRMDEGIKFDLEVIITAGGYPEKFEMDGPEDITCYSLSIESEELNAYEKYLFETQNEDWILDLARQAFVHAKQTGSLSEAIEQAKSKAQDDSVEYEQKSFRVYNDL